jgi:serine/threonine-protein kinase RsbW
MSPDLFTHTQSAAQRSSDAARLRLRLPAESASVAVVRRAVRAMCHELGLAEQAAADVELAASEACSNVVLHAYRPAAERPGPLEVDVDELPGALRVIVRDYGGGVRPRLDSPGAGVGLPLIARLATALRIDRQADPPKTAVVMEFRRAA